MLKIPRFSGACTRSKGFQIARRCDPAAGAKAIWQVTEKPWRKNPQGGQNKLNTSQNNIGTPKPWVQNTTKPWGKNQSQALRKTNQPWKKNNFFSSPQIQNNTDYSKRRPGYS